MFKPRSLLYLVASTWLLFRIMVDGGGAREFPETMSLLTFAAAIYVISFAWNTALRADEQGKRIADLEARVAGGGADGRVSSES